MLKLNTEIVGWVPAIVYPGATLLQVLQMCRSDLAGLRCLSFTAWFLFGLASLGLYVYTRKWKCPKLVLALFVPALMDFCIAGVVAYAALQGQ